MQVLFGIPHPYLPQKKKELHAYPGTIVCCTPQTPLMWEPLALGLPFLMFSGAAE